MLPDIITKHEATMTSLDIETLTGSRHDKVKQSIERLATAGDILLPPLGDIKVKRDHREVTTSAYTFSGERGKRDSFVVVAQLSPTFTAALVDRWLELERNAVTLASAAQEAQAQLLKYAVDLEVISPTQANYLISKMVGADTEAIPDHEDAEYVSIPTLAAIMKLDVLDVRELLIRSGAYGDEPVIVNGRVRRQLSDFGHTIATKKNDKAQIRWKIPDTIEVLNQLLDEPTGTPRIPQWSV